jgi:hypothetical protein
MANTSAYAQSYNSFSGVDIKAVFGNKTIAELQAISYSVTREKAPLYTMGSADPRSFSRGKRGIAGTLVFLVFDRHALLGTLGQGAVSPMYFQSDIDDVMPDPTSNLNTVASTQSITSVGASLGVGASVPGSTIGAQESDLIEVGGDQVVVAPWFVDQIPPFDITLAAANEYGALAVMRIYGVEILNEGYGVSIDDIVSEQQMTYVARTLAGWQSLGLSTKM